MKIPSKTGEGGEAVPEVPRVLGSRLIYEGRVVTMRVDDIELPEGRIVQREVVEHPGAVVVIALDEADSVYFVRQYRHPIKGMLLELPAGGIEAGEDPLSAAKRELREEVGLEGRDWRCLGSFFSSPGFANEHLHAFVVQGLVESDQQLDEDEDLTVERHSLHEVLQRLEVIPDAKSLAALLLLQSDQKRGHQR
jgi:ADP-ribose pyrophosphatase